MSGTLGFVLSAVARGGRSRTAVREAVERGYAEPDPRDDLSGARRRAQGPDPRAPARLSRRRRRAAEDLVPPPLAALPLAQFLERLPALDEAWRARVGRAGARGAACCATS